MVKKFVSLLLCVILALGALPLSAGAAKNPGDSHTITFHYEDPDDINSRLVLNTWAVKGSDEEISVKFHYNFNRNCSENDSCDSSQSATFPYKKNGAYENPALPTISETLYSDKVFLGWYTNSSFNDRGIKISNDELVNPDITHLYAQYFDKSSLTNSYLIVYNYRNATGTYLEAISSQGTGTSVLLPAPTRSGYRFCGWYDDTLKGATKFEETDANGLSAGEVKQLYARWIPESSKLTAYLPQNSSTLNISVSYNQTTSLQDFWDEVDRQNIQGPNSEIITGWSFVDKDQSAYTDADIVLKRPAASTASRARANSGTILQFLCDNAAYAPLEVHDGKEVPVLSLYPVYGTVSADTVKLTLTGNGGKFTYQGVDKGDNFDINVASGTTFGNALKDVTATNTDSGLILKGWSTSSTGYVPVDLTAPINSSQTIYAVWGTAITVSVNPNGGTYDGSALPKSINIPSGTTFADFKANYLKQELLKPDNSALREFSSWYLRDEMYPNDATKFHILKDNDEFNQDITIHAAWKAVTTPPADEIIVSFDLNYTGAPAGPADIKIGDTLKYGQLPQVTRAGYNFLGWFAEKSGGTEAKTNGSLVKQESHTLYAHWGQMGSINLNPDGGTLADGEPKSVTPVDGKYPELPDPTRAGYTFQGWFTAQKDSGVRVKEGDAVSPADIGMIYAHWKANTYTVAYDLNYTGAPAAPTDKTVTYDQKYGPLAQPDRSGYTFLGWFTQPSGGLEVKAEDTVQITQKQTLFAHWQEGDPVTLELQGGKLPDGVSGGIGVTPGGKYPTLPVPTRTGYTFEGWFTKAEDGSQVESGDSVGEKAPEKLYAHWTARKVTVNFDYNGAPGSRDPRTYNYGAKYTNLPASARWDGHTFLGWFTAATGGTQITKDSTVSVPEGTDETEGLSITLYAHWGFQISYEANGGSGEMESSTAPMDSPFTLPSCTFTPPYGMVFDRWAVGSLKGEHLTAGATHTFNRNTTLYATWKESPVTITATCTSGGSLITTTGQSNTVTVDKGQDVTFNATANYGYELVDLIVDGESLYALESYTFRSVMENHTIHAVFQRIAPDDYITCPRDYTCPLSRFSDLNPREWYHDAVHYCLDEVIMNGVSSNRYGPNMPTSRAMLTMALWRAEGRPDAVGGGALTRPYKDVPSTEWFYRCIVWATRTGVVNGYSATAFGPNDNITREQVVTILWRHAGSPAPRSYNLPFYDDWATSSYAWNAMCWAYENGIIKGRPNRILDPRGNAKRVEIAEIMKNYLLNYSKRT